MSDKTASYQVRYWPKGQLERVAIQETSPPEWWESTEAEWAYDVAFSLRCKGFETEIVEKS